MKKSEFEFRPNEADAGERIDKVLGRLPEIGSRSKAELLLHEGLITKDGRPVRSSHRVELGKTYQIRIPTPAPTELTPFAIDLDVFHEDDHIIVINKPAGLVVHPAAGHAQDTLVNALMALDTDFEMSFGENRPGIVHRLDKDTSGLLVVAKTNVAQDSLVAQFKSRSVHRRYQAVTMARGLPSQGDIQSFLARHPGDRKRFASVRDPAGRILRDQSSPPAVGKWARTHFQTVARLASGLSLIVLKLETGRTHQIRVHLSEAGAPIVADPVYLKSPNLSGYGQAEKSVLARIPRLALHAFELGFAHPADGRKMSFVVDWPSDMRELLRELNLWRDPNVL